jgi:hypothetical protein
VASARHARGDITLIVVHAAIQMAVVTHSVGFDALQWATTQTGVGWIGSRHSTTAMADIRLPRLVQSGAVVRSMFEINISAYQYHLRGREFDSRSNPFLMW